MSTSQNSAAFGQAGDIPNGPGAAAILAAGIGCGLMGILAFAGDASDAIGKFLNFYDPVGTLSGVTTVTIVVWLGAWFVLARMWATKNVAMGKVNLVSFALLIAGLLLTFPPFMDLLQGK
jgi:hypothetical protein